MRVAAFHFPMQDSIYWSKWNIPLSYRPENGIFHFPRSDKWNIPFIGQKWIRLFINAFKSIYEFHFPLRLSIYWSKMEAFIGQKWNHLLVKMEPFIGQKWNHLLIKNGTIYWSKMESFIGQNGIIY